MTVNAAFNATAIAFAEQLNDTARGNQIGPKRFAAMNSIRTAADALYQAAELIADGRSLDDPTVILYRRVAGRHGGL